MKVVTENSVMKTEVVFSEDKKHRFLLSKEWDLKNKKRAAVIMISPSISDEIMTDYTTMLVINNLRKLDFGAVDIVNLFSDVTGSRAVKGIVVDVEKLNDQYIVAAAEKADAIIIAWGTIGESNKSIKKRQELLLEQLLPFSVKMQQIQDLKGKIGFHPLSPQVRGAWQLVRYHYQPIQTDKPIMKSKKKVVNDNIVQDGEKLND